MVEDVDDPKADWIEPKEGVVERIRNGSEGSVDRPVPSLQHPPKLIERPGQVYVVKDEVIRERVDVGKAGYGS